MLRDDQKQHVTYTIILDENVKDGESNKTNFNEKRLTELKRKNDFVRCLIKYYFQQPDSVKDYEVPCDKIVDYLPNYLLETKLKSHYLVRARFLPLEYELKQQPTISLFGMNGLQKTAPHKEEVYFDDGLT